MRRGDVRNSRPGRQVPVGRQNEQPLPNTGDRQLLRRKKTAYAAQRTIRYAADFRYEKHWGCNTSTFRLQHSEAE